MQDAICTTSVCSTISVCGTRCRQHHGAVRHQCAVHDVHNISVQHKIYRTTGEAKAFTMAQERKRCLRDQHAAPDIEIQAACSQRGTMISIAVSRFSSLRQHVERVQHMRISFCQHRHKLRRNVNARLMPDEGFLFA